MMNSTLTERRVYSQHGEDGIIESLIRYDTPPLIVEIGTGDGTECQSRNLIENHEWEAILLDPYFGHWITAENVNDYIPDVPIGVLSIDVDGNDYWIWKAIQAQPDIVCIEYNAHFGHEPVTIPYNPSFKWKRNGHWFRGASLAALADLGSSKGYSLVGCESSGTNAFFVRAGLLEAQSPSKAFVESTKRVAGEIDFGQLVRV